MNSYQLNMGIVENITLHIIATQVLHEVQILEYIHATIVHSYLKPYLSTIMKDVTNHSLVNPYNNIMYMYVYSIVIFKHNCITCMQYTDELLLFCY